MSIISGLSAFGLRASDRRNSNLDRESGLMCASDRKNSILDHESDLMCTSDLTNADSLHPRVPCSKIAYDANLAHQS